MQLQEGILYYDLPKDSRITRQCETITELPLTGNGIITIPSGCAIIHKMKNFINRLSKRTIQTQQVLHIAEEVLSHPEYIDSLWNRAKDSIGTVAFATTMATVLSILFTQCSNICACLGLWKIKKERKVRKMKMSVRFARAPRIDDDITRITSEGDTERDADDYIWFENDQPPVENSPPPVYPRLFRNNSPPK